MYEIHFTHDLVSNLQPLIQWRNQDSVGGEVKVSTIILFFMKKLKKTKNLN